MSDNDLWWDYLCPSMANIGILKQAQSELIELGCDWAEAGRILSRVQKFYVDAAFKAAREYEDANGINTAPAREDGRVLPKPLFRPTNINKKVKAILDG